MADIIKCSGGDPLDFLSPVPLGERTVIVTCDDDLSMCREAAEAGVPVCSTEFILGGVLKQELDLKSYPLIYYSLSIIKVLELLVCCKTQHGNCCAL